VKINNFGVTNSSFSFINSTSGVIDLQAVSIGPLSLAGETSTFISVEGETQIMISDVSFSSMNASSDKSLIIDDSVISSVPFSVNVSIRDTSFLDLTV
jgi:hypothetical protein